MASQRPTWPDILDPAFRKIYGDEIRQLQQQVFSIFNVDTSVKNIEKDSSATGLSRLVQTSESAPITYEDEVEGYNVIYTHLKFAKGTSVSQELWEDDFVTLVIDKLKMIKGTLKQLKQFATPTLSKQGLTI
jgi:hypothetical protein